MGAATVAVFVVLLFGVDRMAGGGLVERIFSGTLQARTRADYSVTTDQRVKPIRPSSVNTGTGGTGGTNGTNGRG